MFNPKFGIGILKHPGYNDIFSAAASIFGASEQADAAQYAADVQANTAAQQMALQKQIYETQQAQQAPYRASGYTALNQIGSMLPGTYTQYDAEGKPIGTATGSGYLTRQFTNQDLNQYLAPNYAWQLSQGQGALTNQLNATGGLVGGNALKGMQDYTQNFAKGAYTDAFNQFQTQRGNIYNTLAGIAGIGQTSQQQANTAAQNYGTNVGNLATGSAAAQAAGAVGSANAWAGGMQNVGNTIALNRLLNQGGGINSYNMLPNIGGISGSIGNLFGGGPSFDNSPINTGTYI